MILIVFHIALFWKSDFVRNVYHFTLIFNQSINQWIYSNWKENSEVLSYIMCVKIITDNWICWQLNFCQNSLNCIFVWCWKLIFFVIYIDNHEIVNINVCNVQNLKIWIIWNIKFKRDFQCRFFWNKNHNFEFFVLINHFSWNTKHYSIICEMKNDDFVVFNSWFLHKNYISFLIKRIFQIRYHNVCWFCNIMLQNSNFWFFNHNSFLWFLRSLINNVLKCSHFLLFAACDWLQLTHFENSCEHDFDDLHIKHKCCRLLWFLSHYLQL